MTQIKKAMSVGNKPNDYVSVKDFATPQEALASGESILFPDGVYNLTTALALTNPGQSILLSAGVNINQLTPDLPVFTATGLDRVWLFCRGALLTGEGAWSAAWTGNSGHDDRVVRFITCTNSGITDPLIKNGANAGLSIEGCKGFRGLNLGIEGTHVNGGVLPSLANFQNGIYIKHSSTLGDCEDVICTFDISGAAQGVLVEAYAGYSGDGTIGLKGVIHDIPGQHGMYVQAGDITAEVIVRDVELDGCKVQNNQSSGTVDNVDIRINCKRAGSHALEVQDADGSGTMTNIVGHVISDACQRGLGLNVNIKQSSFKVLATDSTQYGAIVQGVGLDDIDIDLQSTGSGRHGLYVTASDCKDLRIKPIVRQANTDVGAFDGILIEAAGDLTLIDPEGTDGDSNQRYGLFVDSATAQVKVRGSAKFTGAATSSARSDVELVEWPEEVTLDGTTAAQLANFANFTQSSRPIHTQVQSTTATNVTLWQKAVPDEAAMEVTMTIVGKLAGSAERRTIKSSRFVYRDAGGVATFEGASFANDGVVSAGFNGVFAWEVSGNNVRMRVNSGGTAVYDWIATTTYRVVSG